MEPGEDAELVTGEAVALDVRPAGFLLRAGGAVIDWAVYLLVFLGLSLAISFTAGNLLDDALATALGTASLAFSLVVVPVVVELASGGRSLGKWAVGARIVRDDGGAIRFRHSFIRALTGVVEIFLTFGGLAALVALLGRRSKRLGDLLAGTYSQHERVPQTIEPVYGMPPGLERWAAIADVARMPDRLSRRIAAFVKQGARMTPLARERLAAGLAEEAAAFVSPMPRTDAQSALTAIAAIRRDRDYAALLLERDRLQRLRPILTGLPHDFPER